jgi:predicted metal-binding protein
MQLIYSFTKILRNYRDLEAILEELGAIKEKELILADVQYGNRGVHSFLYVDLRAKSKNHIFHIRFEKRIEIED